MLKYALVSALFLVGFAQADERIEKSDVNKILVMKTNELYIELKNDEWYRGDIITPDCLRGKLYFDSGKTIHKTYKLQTHNGFKTCQFSKLERIA